MELWVGLAYLAFLVAYVIRFPTRQEASHFSFGLGVGCSVTAASNAVHSLMAGDWPMGLVWGALAGLQAYIAWRDRPRRKKRPKRVWAKVVDLGHRLAVE